MNTEPVPMLEYKTDLSEKKHFFPEQHFGRRAPLELEIGCGKGKFLVARAEESPERDFIGIDYAAKWMKVGQTRGAKRQLGNLLFVKTHALDFLKMLPDACADLIHMYFPDPWPKRRHRPRRLFGPDYLKLVHQKLKPSGLFEVATDDLDYYEHMKKAVDQSEISWQDHKEAVNQRIHCPHLKTNYELKFETAGRTLRYMELRKLGNAL